MDPYVLSVAVTAGWNAWSYVTDYLIQQPHPVFQSVVFGCLLGLTVTSYVRACITHPGRVPLVFADKHYDLLWDPHTHQGVYKHKKRYCATCSLWKPPRTHHCTVCRQCVLRYDHHCPWIANCVGHYNYKYFLLLIGYLTAISWFMALTSGRSALACLHELADGDAIPYCAVAAGGRRWNFVLSWCFLVLLSLFLATFSTHHFTLMLLRCGTPAEGQESKSGTGR
eukprot:Hpha_TRINITY_DN13343_c1_g1::TRINITY_DN13343_c1_g1_i2::g.95358::m.95358